MFRELAPHALIGITNVVLKVQGCGFQSPEGTRFVLKINVQLDKVDVPNFVTDLKSKLWAYECFNTALSWNSPQILTHPTVVLMNVTFSQTTITM